MDDTRGVNTPRTLPSTSPRRSGGPGHNGGTDGISRSGLIALVVSTVVALALVAVTRDSGESQDVVTESTPPSSVSSTSQPAVDESSASSLFEDVDSDGLFSAGARVELPDAGRVLDGASSAGVQASDLASTSPVDSSASQRDLDDSAVRTDGATRAADLVSPSGQAEGSTSPTTASSSNVSPTTAAPTTQAPTTAAPTTAAPTTAAPTTEAPTTEAPTTTAAPTTAAPVPTTQAPPAETAPPPDTTGEPTADQWAAVRQCEAGGSYTIVSRSGLYHGAYQFHQQTWDSVAGSLGRTDLVGIPPEVAAASDQDALALQLWRQRGNAPWPHCGVHLPPGP